MMQISRERMLLHEVNHRTINEFAAAISAGSLAARRSNNDEVKAALSLRRMTLKSSTSLS